jgi:hypothetical protein
MWRYPDTVRQTDRHITLMPLVVQLHNRIEDNLRTGKHCSGRVDVLELKAGDDNDLVRQ